MRAFRLIAAVATVLSAACAHVEHRTATHDSYLRTEVVDLGKQSKALVRQKADVASDFSSGTLELTLVRETHCLTQKRNVYARREYTERRITRYAGIFKVPPASPEFLIGSVLVTGATSTAIGVYRYNQAPSLSDEPRFDPETGDELKSDQDIAYEAGYVGMGIGIPLMAIAVFDAVRAIDGPSRSMGEIAKDQTTDAKDCGSVPITGTVAVGPVQRRVVLGSTDPHGVVRVDIQSLSRVPNFSASEPLFAGEEPVGDLPLPADLSRFLIRTSALDSADKAEVLRYIEDYPRAFSAADAVKRREALLAQEAEVFAGAMAKPTIESLADALARYPLADPALRKSAETKLHELEYSAAKKAGTAEALAEFSRRYPDSLQAKAAAEDLDKKKASEATEGFQSLKWGMTRAQVLRVRPNAKSGEGSYQAESMKVADEEANVFYGFTTRDRLSDVTVEFTERYINSENHVAQFRRVKELLRKKYGQPITDTVRWTNDLYRNDPERLGTAVGVGHATQIAIWRTAETEIVLLHSGEKFRNLVAIRYTSSTFAGQRNAEQEADKLSDL